MSRLVVAEGYRWDEYPGLRPGRIFSGKGDVNRSPRGVAHAVEAQDAQQTVCGLPRASFPHEFPATADLGLAQPCATCLS